MVCLMSVILRIGDGLNYSPCIAQFMKFLDFLIVSGELKEADDHIYILGHDEYHFIRDPVIIRLQRISKIGGN